MAETIILHIEDTWECQQLVRAVLTYHGYQVVSAETGEEGVELVQKLHPSAILMDVHLPGIDGLEATRQIRNLPSTSNIPIIALTATDESVDAQRAANAGCNAYLSKPFSPARLVSLVRQYAEQAQAQV